MRESKIIVSSVLLGFCFLMLFFFLEPKTSTLLFPQKNHVLLTQLINDTRENQDINLQQYWEFREFYSPGVFVSEEHGISKDHYPAVSSFISQDKLAIPQLLFTSKKVISVGGRTKSKLFLNKNGCDKNSILKTHSVFISENETSFTIIFLKPVAEVKKANGFIRDDTVSDEKYGERWLEITTIQK